MTEKIKKLFMLAGLAFVSVGTYFFLAPRPPSLLPPLVGHLDKVLHFIVYACYASWFYQLAPKLKVFWTLFGLGVAIELTQSMTGRMFDPLDILANSAGKATILLLPLNLNQGYLHMISRWLTRPK